MISCWNITLQSAAACQPCPALREAGATRGIREALVPSLSACMIRGVNLHQHSYAPSIANHGKFKCRAVTLPAPAPPCLAEVARVVCHVCSLGSRGHQQEPGLRKWVKSRAFLMYHRMSSLLRLQIGSTLFA